RQCCEHERQQQRHRSWNRRRFTNSEPTARLLAAPSPHRVQVPPMLSFVPVEMTAIAAETRPPGAEVAGVALTVSDSSGSEVTLFDPQFLLAVNPTTDEVLALAARARFQSQYSNPFLGRSST